MWFTEFYQNVRKFFIFLLLTLPIQLPVHMYIIFKKYHNPKMENVCVLSKSAKTLKVLCHETFIVYDTTEMWCATPFVVAV